MAKRKMAQGTQVASAPQTNGKAPPADIRWITVEIPVFTGTIDCPHDVRVQCDMTDMVQREGWMRLHKGIEELANQQSVVFGKLKHDRSESVRWLLKRISDAIAE